MNFYLQTLIYVILGIIAVIGVLFIIYLSAKLIGYGWLRGRQNFFEQQSERSIKDGKKSPPKR